MTTTEIGAWCILYTLVYFTIASSRKETPKKVYKSNNNQANDSVKCNR